MVGAVGIENNDVRHFKDLPGMQRNAKSLKWNERARKGILIAPSKLPRISSFQWNSLPSRLEDSVGFGPKFCGADGKSTLRGGWPRTDRCQATGYKIFSDSAFLNLSQLPVHVIGLLAIALASISECHPDAERHESKRWN